MSKSVAYVASGKLHLKYEDVAPRAVESKFAGEMRERLQRMASRNAWKTEGTGAQFMSGRLLWGMDAEEKGVPVMSVQCLTRGPRDGQVLYALGGKDVSGLFSFDPETKDEIRIVHGADHVYYDLALHRELGLVACSAPKRDGSASIGVMQHDATEYSDLTEGDSLDMNPSWVPGERRELVFASSGIARNANGYPTSFAPSVIHRVDLDTAQMDVVAEEKGHDLIRPMVGSDGTLYYIRRPHVRGDKPSFWRANLDFLLFPFRLLSALMHYLNFFSTRYTGKQLTTAGSTNRRGADVKQMMEWNNLIRAGSETTSKDDDPDALVPSSWQLVRQRGMKVETVARNVATYDLCADGSVVYTNGSAIFRVSPDGEKTKICDGAYISHVIAL